MTAALAFAALALVLPTVVDRPPAVADGARGSWQAVDLEGRTWSPEALRGRIVLVDFWATWCAPCLDDLPRLKRLHARYAPRGLTIVGVSLDRSSVRDFRSWLQRQAIAWPQIREAGGYDSPLARHFGVDAIPASYLYDRDGRLLDTHLRGPALEARVAALMEAR
jgi:thiol-disulfide isomerase/thioredoxin